MLTTRRSDAGEPEGVEVTAGEKKPKGSKLDSSVNEVESAPSSMLKKRAEKTKGRNVPEEQNSDKVNKNGPVLEHNIEIQGGAPDDPIDENDVVVKQPPDFFLLLA